MQPLQLTPINSFLGTHEGLNNIILPDVLSPSGSQNVYVDKHGRLRKVPGFAKLNTTATTTNTGGSTAWVVGLYPYKSISGVTVTRQLVKVIDDGADEWEIWTSADDGVTWTFRFDAGSGSITRLPDFAQYKTTLYVTNGVSNRSWNGTSIATIGQTQSPTVTSASSATGTNLTGNYKWKLVSVVADATRSPASVASTNLLLQSEQASLSWTADADTNVTGYELYRTIGTGTVYYFVGAIDGRTTVVYTDNVPDSVILSRRALLEYGDAPPTSWFCELHKERMFWLRTDAQPQRAYFSDAGLPESVGTTNYFDFADNDQTNDVLTGALGNFQNKLLVFLEKAIWTVSGTGVLIGDIQDWTKKKTNASVGTVSHRTVIRVPAGARFMAQNGSPIEVGSETIAYLTPYNDIRLFDGVSDVIISHPVKTSLDGHNYTVRSTAFALHDVELGHITWFYANGADTYPTRGVMWNYRTGLWTRIVSVAFRSGTVADSSTDSNILLTGNATTGLVFKYWDTSVASFNTVAIDARWMSNTLRGVIGQDPTDNAPTSPAMAHRKRWRWVDVLLVNIDPAVTLTVEWFKGDTADTATAVGSSTIVGNDTTRSVSQDKMLLKNSSGDFLHDEGVRIRISDNASNGSWGLEGLTLAHQILPGLRRRFQ